MAVEIGGGGGGFKRRWRRTRRRWNWRRWIRWWLPFSDGDSEGDDEEEGTREGCVDALLELIRNTIEPDSWRENGGTDAAIAELGSQLVVTQTTSAHADIQDLLGKLRDQRAIQIAIEARFITITSNYLEELGLDLDVVLNQGNAGFDRTGQSATGSQVLIPRSFCPTWFPAGYSRYGSDPQPVAERRISAVRQPGSDSGAGRRLGQCVQRDADSDHLERARPRSTEQR
ncbi:MAG: hypothetical protein R3E58_11755 [Phycisphaerae bacterium]